MRVRIYLDGYQQTKEFCKALNMTNFKGRAELVSDDGRYRVNAKSFLSCLVAHTEWTDVWFESDSDLYTLIEPWIDIEHGDGNYIHK